MQPIRGDLELWNFVKIGLNRNSETVVHLPGLRTLQWILTSELTRIIMLILLERKRDFFLVGPINEVRDFIIIFIIRLLVTRII